MLLTAKMNLLNLEASSPPAIGAGTWSNISESAAALPAQAGSGMTEPGLSARSWMQSPRPGIRRQRKAP